MGSIVGCVGDEPRATADVVMKMLKALRHRGPYGSALLSPRGVSQGKSPEELDTSSLESPAVIGLNHTHLGGTLKPPLLPGSFPIALDREVPTPLEPLEELQELQPLQDPASKVREAVEDMLGGFALAVAGGGWIVLARDRIGIKPLYWGVGRGMAAFASERKALWRGGFSQVEAIPPGAIARLTPQGLGVESRLEFEKPKPLQTDLELAAERLLEVLEASLGRRLSGMRGVGVLFSGGVDSSLLAYLTSGMGLRVTLLAGGLEGSPDLQAAEEASGELGLRLVVETSTLDELEPHIREVVHASETNSPMDVGIALPLYLVAKGAAKLGLEFALVGQGADELFGGYTRYLRILSDGGYSALEDSLWRDLVGLGSGLQRDDAATMASGVELSCPYLDLDFVKVASSIPPALKVESRSDHLRKRVLRKAADLSGLPLLLAYREKKAAQYGSGADKALRKIAKKRHTTPQDYLRKVLGEVFSDYSGFSKEEF